MAIQSDSIASSESATRFRVDATAESACTARNLIADWASALECMSEEALCDLTIAVGETFANIVNHSIHRNDPVVIEARKGPDHVAVTFDYATEPFNPSPDAPTPDEMAVGGYGLFIVRSLMDIVDYQFSQGRVLVKLQKQCHPGH